MKIALTMEGSLLFSEPPNLILRSHRQDESNPLLFHMKFEPCRFREGDCKMSPCGTRPIFKWTCKLLCKAVNIQICEACNVREEDSSAATESR